MTIECHVGFSIRVSYGDMSLLCEHVAKFSVEFMVNNDLPHEYVWPYVEVYCILQQFQTCPYMMFKKSIYIYIDISHHSMTLGLSKEWEKTKVLSLRSSLSAFHGYKMGLHLPISDTCW